MLKIGLTGGIGSGKSVVAQVFSILNIPVYNADKKAKILMQENSGLKKSIIHLLGHKAYEGNFLATNYIAEKIFNDSALLEKMNALVHPAVLADFLSWSRNHLNKAYVIEEAALIYESNHSNAFDYVVVVSSPDKLRIERVMKRDGISKSDVLTKMKSQLSQDRKLDLADFIIENDEERLVTPQVLDLHNKFVSLQTKK
jgi:dephospho-CoA kinase